MVGNGSFSAGRPAGFGELGSNAGSGNGRSSTRVMGPHEVLDVACDRSARPVLKSHGDYFKVLEEKHVKPVRYFRPKVPGADGAVTPPGHIASVTTSSK